MDSTGQTRHWDMLRCYTVAGRRHTAQCKTMGSLVFEWCSKLSAARDGGAQRQDMAAGAVGCYSGPVVDPDQP